MVITSKRIGVKKPPQWAVMGCQLLQAETKKASGLGWLVLGRVQARYPKSRLISLSAACMRQILEAALLLTAPPAGLTPGGNLTDHRRDTLSSECNPFFKHQLFLGVFALSSNYSRRTDPGRHLTDHRCDTLSSVCDPFLKYVLTRCGRGYSSIAPVTFVRTDLVHLSGGNNVSQISG